MVGETMFMKTKTDFNKKLQEKDMQDKQGISLWEKIKSEMTQQRWAITRNKFPMEIKTPGDQWVSDMKWRRVANPVASWAEDRWNEADKQMFLKNKFHKEQKSKQLDGMYKSKEKKIV